MLSKITKKQLWELLVAIVHNVVASGFQLSSKQLASAAELERLRVVALFRYSWQSSSSKTTINTKYVQVNTFCFYNIQFIRRQYILYGLILCDWFT